MPGGENKDRPDSKYQQVLILVGLHIVSRRFATSLFPKSHGRHTALREIYLQDQAKGGGEIDLFGSHCHEY